MFLLSEIVQITYKGLLHISRFKKYYYKIFWLIFALILVYLSNIVTSQAKDYASRTFEIYFLYFTYRAVPLILGMYLSTYNGIPKLTKLNKSVFFIIVIPTFLIHIYPMLGIPYPMHMTYELHSTYFIGVICGYSFIRSITK